MPLPEGYFAIESDESRIKPALPSGYQLTDQTGPISISPPTIPGEDQNKLWALQHPEEQKKIEQMSFTDRLLAGVKRGMQHVYHGLQQFESDVFAPTVSHLGDVLPGKEGRGVSLGQEVREEAARRSSVSKETEAKQAQAFEPLSRYSKAAKWGEFGGEAGTWMAAAPDVPGGESANAFTRMAGSAAMGGLMGAAQPVKEGQGRLGNIAVGAGAGAGVSGLTSLAGEGMNAFKGNYNLDEAGLNRWAGSKQQSIPMTLSEIKTGQPSMADMALEQIPGIGTKGWNEQRLAKAESSAEDFFSQYVAGGDIHRTTASMKESNQEAINAAYDKIDAWKDTIPQAEAPLTKAKSKEFMDNYPDVFTALQNKRLKTILSNISETTADIPTTTAQSGILDRFGRPMTTTIPGGPKTFSFNDLDTARKDLWQAMKSAPNDEARGQLKTLYRTLLNDEEAMLEKAGGPALAEFKAAQKANVQYKVKFDVLRQAYDQAEGTVGAGEMFSPKRFSTALKNLAGKPDNLAKYHFTDDEVEKMTGLANVLQVVKRAGQYTEKPPTGVRWGPLNTAANVMKLGGGVLGGGTGVGALAGSTTTGAEAAAGTLVAGTMASLITKFFTTNEAGQRFALAASKIEPGSEKMALLLYGMYQQLPKFAAQSGISYIRGQEPVDMSSTKTQPEVPPARPIQPESPPAPVETPQPAPPPAPVQNRRTFGKEEA